MARVLESSFFGQIEYQSEEVYQFEKGIPGFPEQTEFIFIKVEETPFTVMHATKEDLYFFLVDPFSFVPGYQVALPDSVIEQLEVKERNNVLCYCVVVVKEPLETSTANLAAPIVLNTQSHKGIQFVLEKTSYSVRYPIFVKEKCGAANKQG